MNNQDWDRYHELFYKFDLSDTEQTELLELSRKSERNLCIMYGINPPVYGEDFWKAMGEVIERKQNEQMD